jgi:hypothetical protein
MMPEREIDEDILNFHFIAIATATYDDPRLGDLPETRGEVQALADWFCNEKLADRAFTHRYPELAEDPTKAQVDAALRGPWAGREWRESDAVVVYITGHGRYADEDHWVALGSTVADDIPNTALRTADLIRGLKRTTIRQLFVIIDTCYAGNVRGGIDNFENSLPGTWLILGSAEKNKEAMSFALTKAIQQALIELGGKNGAKYGHERFLAKSAFVGAVERKLAGQELEIIHVKYLDAEHVCLPNPHFEPSTAASVLLPRRDLAVPGMDMEEHWTPRALGGTRGWLFAGRAKLMKRLIAATTGAPGTVLVTGGAGSGKSAVLARLVTLTDPGFRSHYAEEVALVPAELLPEAEAVDIAVLATGKSATQIMTQICQAAGALDTTGADASLDVDPLDRAQKAWLSWLRITAKRVTIVVDALDEAAAPNEVLTQVLQQLEDPRRRDSPSRAHQVRLIVGVRSLGAPAQGGAPPPTPAAEVALADRVQRVLGIDPADRRIQVDEEPWWVRQDVVDYVARVLRLSPGSPYAGAGGEVETIAGIVAEAAGKSFLFAKMAAEQLADRKADISDPAWHSAITRGVLGLFKWDLHHSLPDEPEQRLRAVHLLRAVAFAFGPGLPWLNTWPLVASAIADEEDRYQDEDIVWLLGTRLGGYLVTDVVDGVTVYRLFHDDLRNILREQWQELLNADPEHEEAE